MNQLKVYGDFGSDVQSSVNIAYMAKKINNACIIIHPKNNAIRATHAIQLFTSPIPLYRLGCMQVEYIQRLSYQGYFPSASID